MRPASDVERVAALLDDGRTIREAARDADVPETTVRRWVEHGLDDIAARHRDRGPCGSPCERVTIAPADRYAYLLGQYLGDGSIVAFPRADRLEIVGDARYPGILGEIADAMASVLPPSKVGSRRRQGCVVLSSYSKHWRCLLPQHGPGRKHLRRIELEPWQRAIVEAHPKPFLRGLVHSDGCRVDNVVNGRAYARYHFSNRSDDIRSLFSWACGLVGVECRPNNRWNLSVAKRACVERMDSFVGPKR